MDSSNGIPVIDLVEHEKSVSVIVIDDEEDNSKIDNGPEDSKRKVPRIFASMTFDIDLLEVQSSCTLLMRFAVAGQPRPLKRP